MLMRLALRNQVPNCPDMSYNAATRYPVACMPRVDQPHLELGVASLYRAKSRFAVSFSFASHPLQFF